MILFLGITCLVLAWAVLRPDSALGRVFHDALIAAPIRLLNGNGFAKMLASILVLLFVLSMMTAPELFAIMAISDLTIYFEVVALAALLGAGARIKVVLGMVSLPVRITRRLHRAMTALHRRAGGALRRPRRKRAAAKEPDLGWAPRFA